MPALQILHVFLRVFLFEDDLGLVAKDVTPLAVLERHDENVEAKASDFDCLLVLHL